MVLAKETGLPVMLFFTADWCGYCKKLIRAAFSNDKVAEAVSRVIPILVDIDKNTTAGPAYKIRGVPTVIFLDSKGRRVETFTGARDAGTYINAIEDVTRDLI